ncbi:Plug domain-containing protein, partial [Pseudomonadales bacterium]|nr:Plug domain-containing protein [Pseudomonadales bacterium]
MYVSRSGQFLSQQFFYLLAIIFISTLVTFSQSSSAQALEEIIVTSQKRAESLQDVSVSVTALSGEKLADGAIARLEEVTAFVPNFTLTETGIGTNIYIRGIGSGINQGFEQSVGMYFDGIYY